MLFRSRRKPYQTQRYRNYGNHYKEYSERQWVSETPKEEETQTKIESEELFSSSVKENSEISVQTDPLDPDVAKADQLSYELMRKNETVREYLVVFIMIIEYNKRFGQRITRGEEKEYGS